LIEKDAGCGLGSIGPFVFGWQNGDWVLRFRDGPEIAGLTQILDHYGEDGWELINFLPFYEEGYEQPGLMTNVVRGYTAVFKRPRQ
jgi:hypothetical protein